MSGCWTISSKVPPLPMSNAPNASHAPQVLVEPLSEAVPGETHSHWFGTAAVFVVLLALWEWACRGLDVSSTLLPAPSAIGLELVHNLPTLLRHSWVTTVELVTGFAVATVIGIALAIVVDHSPFLSSVIRPYIIALQAMPKVALAPFFVIWFGFGITSKIAMAAIITFFPIFVSAVAGFAAISPRMVDLMTVLQASKSQVMWKAKVPAALPYIFAGLEIGILLALIGAIVGEFVSATAGLGYLIATYNAQLRTASAFAA